MVKDMDLEWLELILEAKNMGITIETIRDFLSQNEVNRFSIEKP